MKKIRLAAAAMAAAVLVTGGSVPALGASAQEQIEAIQGEKAQSESALAETQERITDLENQRGDLENYLAELSRQYEDLTISLEELKAKAEQKQKELQLVKKELKNAREKEKKQYESMKIRISYMYEKSKGNFLTELLSADSFTDFLARAENFMQISKYDRKMLEKYEQAKEKVQDQKQAVKVEEESIVQLQKESARKRQEVESLGESVEEEILMYAQEIEHSEGEAVSLLDKVNQQSAQLISLAEVAEALMKFSASTIPSRGEMRAITMSVMLSSGTSENDDTSVRVDVVPMNIAMSACSCASRLSSMSCSDFPSGGVCSAWPVMRSLRVWRIANNEAAASSARLAVDWL